MDMRIAIFLVAVVACAIGPDTGGVQPLALCRAAPTLAADVAHHVVHDDEQAFRAFCAEVGSLRLRAAIGSLHKALEQERFEDYRRASDLVLPYLERLSRGLDEEFDHSGPLRDARFRRSLDPLRGHALHLCLRELRVVGALQGEDPHVRMARSRRLCAQFEAMGYERGVLLAERDLLDGMIKLGDLDPSGSIGRRTLQRAIRLGEMTLACQILGEMGYHHRLKGRPDSSRICYDEGYRLALRYKIPEQAGRFIEFDSNRHAREGRLALATETIVRAQRMCRELRGGGSEVRFVLAAVGRFAELGCWEAAEQQLARCFALNRQLADSPELQASAGLIMQEWRARALVARGELDSARAAYSAIRGTYRRQFTRGPYSILIRRWAEGLLEVGAASEALALIEEDLAYCDSLHIEEMMPPLALLRAEALIALGRPGEAGQSLREFEAHRAKVPAMGTPEQALARETLDARVAEGLDINEASAVANRAWSEVLAYARGLDAGPQAYLTLEDLQDLRRVLHAQRRTSAADGYRLEMAWRTLPSQLGRGDVDAIPPGARNATSWVGSKLPAGEEMHVVYFAQPEFLLRWTATRAGIVRDTLPLPRARCEDDQRTLAALLDPSMRSAADVQRLIEHLRRLAVALLPPGATLASRLYVSPDGPLSAIPFEALNVGPPGEYEPLALTTDVATIRNGVPVSRRRASGAVVLADPDVPAELSRRYPSLRSKGMGRREIETVTRTLPDARVLTGPGARKREVLSAFATASRIHVAAHVGRIPELPFLTFVPLAVPPGADEAESMLEVKDVRSVDLSGCDLVILSGCGTGVPYVSRGRVAPSLGDAFLDAGARAVIHTLRDIGDDEAVAFMERMLRAPELDADPVAAVNRSRREFIAHTERGHNPTAWATWSVALRVAPWTNGASPRPKWTSSSSTTRSPLANRSSPTAPQ